MAFFRLLLAVALLVPAFSGYASATPASKFKVQIVPMGCQFTVIDTGTNEIEYLTPAACTQTTPPPNNPPSPPAPEPDPIPEPLVEPQIPPIIAEILDNDPPEEAEQVVVNLSEVKTFQQGASYYVSIPEGKKIQFTARDTEKTHAETHSVTVKEIGANYVVLTIASTPFDTKIYVGSQNQYDVTGDGVFDIEVTLRGISDKGADLVFRSLAVTDPGPATPTSFETPVPSRSYGWLYAVVLGSVGVLGAVVLIVRRKRRSPLN